MGSQVLTFRVDPNGDRTVFVEVDDPRQVGTGPISRDAGRGALPSFEAALSDVMPGVNVLMAKLQDAVHKPDTVKLEFGIKFTAGANALIANTAVEGNIKVTLQWQASDPAKSPPAAAG
jgi:Trypsin-co-occurring domain 1